MPWSYTFNLQNCEKITFCCLNHSVCGICYGGPSKLIQPGNICRGQGVWGRGVVGIRNFGCSEWAGKYFSIFTTTAIILGHTHNSIWRQCDINREEGLRWQTLIYWSEDTLGSIQRPNVPLWCLSVGSPRGLPRAQISCVKASVLGKSSGLSTCVWFYSLRQYTNATRRSFSKGIILKTGRMGEEITIAFKQPGKQVTIDGESLTESLVGRGWRMLPGLPAIPENLTGDCDVAVWG